MSKDKELKYYWHGKGVIHIGDKDYAYGEEVPADGMDNARLEAFMSKGDISNAMMPVKGGPAGADKAEIQRLNGVVAKLEKKVAKADDERKRAIKEKDSEIQTLNEMVAELEADQKEKQALIEKLQKSGQTGFGSGGGGGK